MSKDINFQKEYYAGLGAVAASWAAVEFTIDMCIEIVFRAKPSDQLKEPVPRSFNQKIRFLRKAMRELAAPPALTFPPAVANKLPEYLARAATLSSQRNRMIHAAAVAIIPGDIRFTVTKYDYGAKEHKRESFDLHLDDFTAFIEQATPLINDLLLMVQLWFAEFERIVLHAQSR